MPAWSHDGPLPGHRRLLCPHKEEGFLSLFKCSTVALFYVVFKKSSAGQLI